MILYWCPFLSKVTINDTLLVPPPVKGKINDTILVHALVKGKY